MGSLLTRAGLVALVVAAALGASPAADAAPSWRPPTIVGATDLDAGEPDVAVAPDGEAIAAWVGRGLKGIKVSTRRPGKGWSPPVTIARIGEEVGGPQIAVSGGKAVIVWTDGIRTRSGTATVVLASTRLRGKQWSRPRNISADERWHYEPEGEEAQVAMTRRGKAIVVWTGRNEGHHTVSFIGSATQAPGGTDWTAPVGIRGSFEGEEPQVVTTPAGEAVAIWSAYYNEESRIGASNRPPAGPWKPGGQLSTPGPFPRPQLAVTSRGEAIGAWTKERVEGADPVVQVATRPSGSKWKVKTLEPQSVGGSPKIVTEPGGRATLLWVKSFSFEDHAVVASTHVRGRGWSEAVRVAAEGLELDYALSAQIAVTRGGESIALWMEDFPTGEDRTILSADRRRPRAWSEPTVVSTSSPELRYGASYLQLALAPDGKAFAVWRSFTANGWVIKAAMRPAAGRGS